MNKKVIQKPEEMQLEGQKLAKSLKGGEVILMFGDLGVGKTCFTQGLAQGLGIKDTIKSPSYTFVWSYKWGHKTFYHFDLYRLEKGDDVECLGLYDVVSDLDGVVVVEWADRLIDEISNSRIEIHIEYGEKNSRLLEIAYINS